jgi:UDP-glucose 4-epimerase
LNCAQDLYLARVPAHPLTPPPTGSFLPTRFYIACADKRVALDYWETKNAGTHGMSGRVLVTGGAGFIGSHTAEAYLQAGWEVVVLDDLSRGHERNVPKGARFVRADIRSPEARKTLAGGRFDVLNHHAAQIDVRVSVDRPAFDSEINVVGLVNLLEGAGEGGVRRVVFASSGGVVYGDPEVIPTPETAPKLPVSPYGVSKLAGEFYLHALAALRSFEGVAMRYANVFGPRQDPKSEAGVVSIFVSRLLAGQPLIVFGDGRQTRDYVFVKDVARANVLASTSALPDGAGLDAPAFNIATSKQRSVLDLAESVGEVMRQQPRLEFAPPRAGELFRSALDVSKAKKVLGWAPEYGFEDGLRELVDWFKAVAR